MLLRGPSRLMKVRGLIWAQTILADCGAGEACLDSARHPARCRPGLFYLTVRDSAMQAPRVTDSPRVTLGLVYTALELNV